MMELLEMLEGVTDTKARETIVKLWDENRILKRQHPPPNNIPRDLYILDAKGGGDASIRHCSGLLNRAVYEERMR